MSVLAVRVDVYRRATKSQEGEYRDKYLGTYFGTKDKEYKVWIK